MTSSIPLVGGRRSCCLTPTAPHHTADIISLPAGGAVMKFSILCVFIQVCLTATELVIKIKRGGGTGKSG